MKNFVYSYPVKVYFGEGAAMQYLPVELEKVGKVVMLAYGGGSIHKNGIFDQIMELLQAADKTVVEFSGIMPNPTYEKVQEGAHLAVEKQVDFILAVGGGSVIDCCKIISAQSQLEEDIWEYEFTKHQFPAKFLPMGAVVTASGTGAEQNNGAVITHEDKEIKAGVIGAYANFAILDPLYTLSVPPEQVISGAFDTLSHAMETYFGKPELISVSDEISEAIMRNTITNIRAIVENPEDRWARSELMWDSAMAENGILKLGKITDFQAHQIEHQLGAFTDCNHGKGLAVIHPALYRHIYTSSLARFARVASAVWGIPKEGKTQKELALAGIDALESFIKEIGLPTRFSEMGITDEDILKKVADTCNISPGCAKQLSREEIYQLLEECK